MSWTTRVALGAAAVASFGALIIGACSSGPTCPTVQTSCNGACVDTNNDPANCGACGKTCDTTSLCTKGSCLSLCGAGQQACPVGDGGICTNIQTDNAHCGTCDTTCKPLEVCSGGKCSGGCPANEVGCIPEAGQPFCASTQTDNANCGSCGNTCDPLQVCAGGKCAASCLSTQTECFPDSGVSQDGGVPQPYCADMKNDNANCGACGHVCPSSQPLCSAGTCISPG